MDCDNRVKYIQAQLEQQIDGFSQARRSNKRKAFLFRLSMIACSFFTTVLIGMHSSGAFLQPILTDIALVFSTLVTALGSIDAFYDHRALWVRYTKTTNELKSLRSRLIYLLANGTDALDSSTIDEVFEEFQRILRETNSDWLHLRKKAASKEEA